MIGAYRIAVGALLILGLSLFPARSACAQDTAEAEAVAAKLLLVNMIPKSVSDESNQDSEPNLAVNPVNPLHIAASAFTPNPLGGQRAPIFVSKDGGRNWSLNSVLPGSGAQTGTFDITLRFSRKSGVLYAGVLASPNAEYNILRTSNILSPKAMTVLSARSNVDQPYVSADSQGDKDLVFIGSNDFNAPGRMTATVDRSLDAAKAAPPAGFEVKRLEERAPNPQDSPQIRLALHPRGKIYGVFVHWNSFSGSLADADVVVVRDDHLGVGPTTFQDLKGPDGLAGVKVVSGVKIPWEMPGLGQERLGGDPAIALDPRDEMHVYLAYCDRVGVGDYTLHIVESTDGGRTWSKDLVTLIDTKNPALAINSENTLGLVYQHLAGKGASQEWETHFVRTKDSFKTTTDLLLARMPAGIPVRKFFPYLGDYLHLMAVDKDFYGVFSTSNIPDLDRFPAKKPVFQRNHDFSTKKLLGADRMTEVQPSIDPYFFKYDE